MTNRTLTKFYFTTTFLFVQFFLGFGQNEKTDSTFIKSYREKLILKSFINSKNNKIILEQATNNKQLKLTPNERFRLGVAFNYKWMGLGLSLFNPLKKVNINERGISKGVDFQSKIYLRKIGMDLMIHSYQSYYLNNRKAYSPTPVIHPDIQTFAFGGDFFYIFNHKEYSIKSIFNQTEKQLKSAGTWIAGFKTGVYIINSDSGLIPESAHPIFSEIYEAKGLASVALGFGGGYAYTKVVGNMFYSLSCFPNLTGQVLNYDMIGPYDKLKNDSFFHVQWKGAIGYNSDEYYLAMYFVNESVPLGTYYNIDYKYKFGHFQIVGAKRF